VFGARDETVTCMDTEMVFKNRGLRTSTSSMAENAPIILTTLQITTINSGQNNKNDYMKALESK
jgi:hypothetical protein